MNTKDPDKISVQELKRTKPKDLRLGRYPLEPSIRYYKAKKGVHLSPTTIEEDVRKIRMMGEIMSQLKDEGKVGSLDPRSITQDDIDELIGYFKYVRKIKNNTLVKYMDIMDRYLLTFENDTIYRYKRSDDWPVIRSQKAEKKSLEQDEIQQVFDTLDNYRPEGRMGEWHRIIISGFIPLIYGVACRPKEIFNAKLEDLKLDGDEPCFYVRHPKGEYAWGEKEWVNILRGDMVPRLKDFLDDRKKYLEKCGIDSEYLFPSLETGMPYSGKTIRKIKRDIEKQSGVKFKLKDWRTTYLNVTVDGHEDRMKNASIQLRHTNVAETEKEYHLIQRQKATKRIANVWEENPVAYKRKE